MTHEAINKAAEAAIRKRREGKLNLMLELILGDMVEMHGVREVRLRLLRECRHLREFHT